MNVGDYASVPGEFNRWVYAGGVNLNGLIRPSAGEGKLFQVDTDNNYCESCRKWKVKANFFRSFGHTTKDGNFF